MRDMYISDSILYVGADDKTLDIFESSIRFRTESAITPM